MGNRNAEVGVTGSWKWDASSSDRAGLPASPGYAADEDAEVGK